MVTTLWKSKKSNKTLAELVGGVAPGPTDISEVKPTFEFDDEKLYNSSAVTQAVGIAVGTHRNILVSFMAEEAGVPMYKHQRHELVDQDGLELLIEWAKEHGTERYTGLWGKKGKQRMERLRNGGKSVTKLTCKSQLTPMTTPTSTTSTTESPAQTITLNGHVYDLRTTN